MHELQTPCDGHSLLFLYAVIQKEIMLIGLYQEEGSQGSQYIMKPPLPYLLLGPPSDFTSPTLLPSF